MKGEVKMPQKSGTPKNVLIATRVTPHIMGIVIQMANREGLNTSEWLRNLIISELKNNEALPDLIRTQPEIIELEKEK
jgi:hypothetical protein